MTTSLNPLDKPGTPFDIELMNPNPSSGKNKQGSWYRVSFELTQEDWQMFMDAETKGMLIGARCTVITNDQLEAINQEPKPEKGPHGNEARILVSSGFFAIRQVWDAFGGDSAYQDWVRDRPCVISGDYDYSDKYPIGRCVYAHVRRADESGTAYKPEYSGVPMKQKYHELQHQKGEAAVFHYYLANSGKIHAYEKNVSMEADAKEWFNKMAMKYVTEWSMHVLKDRLGVDSLTWAHPGTVRQWCEELGIEQYLPKGY